MEHITQYRYPHFKLHLLMDDMSFSKGVRPGEALPDFDLPTLDDDRIRKSEFVGRQPLFLTFASVT